MPYVCFAILVSPLPLEETCQGMEENGK